MDYSVELLAFEVSPANQPLGSGKKQEMKVSTLDTPFPTRLWSVCVVISLIGWTSSAYAQLDASASLGLGFNISSPSGPPSTCTSNGNPASCSLTGELGYYNGTATGYGSATDKKLSVTTSVQTDGSHYGTGTPTASVSSSFDDTLSIHNAPTAGILSVTFGYNLQASVGCVIGGESTCASAPVVTLLDDHTVVASASVNSSSFPYSQSTANPYVLSAKSIGTYTVDFAYTASQADLFLSLISSSNCQVGFGVGYCQGQTSGKAWIEGASVIGDPNARIHVAPGIVAAPEMDSGSGVAALTLLLGALAVVRGRYRPSPGALFESRQLEGGTFHVLTPARDLSRVLAKQPARPPGSSAGKNLGYLRRESTLSSASEQSKRDAWSQNPAGRNKRP